MPSSISNSDLFLTSRAVSPGRWMLAVLGAVVIFVLFVTAMEVRLAARGFHAAVIDSDVLWMQQRQRASELGRKALILVGASRIQLDMDLDVLRERTGLEPVQLAIDGSSFIPVMAGLAKDPRVKGTVLVAYQDIQVNDVAPRGQSQRIEQAWEHRRGRSWVPDFAETETSLTEALHHHLRSYADGARPLSSLLLRILPAHAAPQYIVTLPDRAQLADYRRVRMPDLYYARVMRNLAEHVPLRAGMSWNDVDAELRRRIAMLRPAKKRAFELNTQRIAAMVKEIEVRGGRVIFLMMPRSGLVLRMDQMRYPRKSFWDQFTAQVGAPSLNVLDFQKLRAFRCPDGSHLDFRDKAAFTMALIAKLGLNKQQLTQVRSVQQIKTSSQ